MNKSTTTVIALLLMSFMGRVGFPEGLHAQDASPAFANSQGNDQFPAMDILSEDEWQEVDTSVDRALSWLASQQQRDGSFPTLPHGQPGVTSLCVMAFVAHGHLPGEGPYGVQLQKAVEFIVSCQQQNGLLSFVALRGPKINGSAPSKIWGSTVYNHSISSLVLSELYSVESVDQADRLRLVIEKSLQTSLKMLDWPKREVDRGGWRYLQPVDAVHSDLSVTGWQLMFLRSAKNAGFEVEKKPIDEAVAYIRRCYNPKKGTFEYTVGNLTPPRRGMAGAGVLALAHAGFHNSAESLRTGEWILQHPFDGRVRTKVDHNQDRYYYGAFYCCQAMYQIGGRYWEQFFPLTVKTLLAGQRENGSWPPEDNPTEKRFGNAYSTALVVLALGAPNQLLPVFQR